MAAKIKSKEQPDFVLPDTSYTVLKYADSTFAAAALYKCLSQMIKTKAWPIKAKTKFSDLYITGMPGPGYPDIGAYYPKFDHFGPGVYCSTITEDLIDVLPAIISRQTDKFNYANGCVAVLRLLNPEQVFSDMDKVKTLCSDWKLHGRTKSRNVSTDSRLFVFHPPVRSVLDIVESVKILVFKVQHFAELTSFVSFIVSDLERLEKLVKEKQLVDKRLKQLDLMAKTSIQKMDMGFYWSTSKPEYLMNLLSVYEKIFTETDPNFDHNLYLEIKHATYETVQLRKKSNELQKGMNLAAGRARGNFLEMIVESEPLYQYRPVRDLSYGVGKVSSLVLATKGILNNTKPDQMAKFEILHLFLFEKNLDVRHSLDDFKYLAEQTSLRAVKGNFFDGFVY